MTSSRRELEHELNQYVLAATEVIRLRDPALARLLDAPPPVQPREISDGFDQPLLTSGPMFRLKQFLLRFRFLHPALDLARASVVRAMRWRSSSRQQVSSDGSP